MLDTRCIREQRVVAGATVFFCRYCPSWFAQNRKKLPLASQNIIFINRGCRIPYGDAIRCWHVFRRVPARTRLFLQVFQIWKIPKIFFEKFQKNFILKLIPKTFSCRTCYANNIKNTSAEFYSLSSCIFSFFVLWKKYEIIRKSPKIRKFLIFCLKN